MRSKFLSFLFFLPLCFLSANAYAQTADSTIKTFSQDGLKFEYPADWTITDKSSRETQRLLLSKENTIALITLISPRSFVQSREQFLAFQADTFEAYVKAMSKTLGSDNKSAEQEYFCINFNGRKITGTKLTGLYNNETSTGEIYPLVVGRRFIALAYIRNDKESAKTDVVWQDLVKSLSLEAERKKDDQFFDASMDITDRGVINSKAVKLVKPVYSKMYRDNGARGMVEVKVTVNEKGKVISAQAISGHKMLYDEAENAAKRSKFTPTLKCGVPTQITGIIIYNFIP